MLCPVGWAAAGEPIAGEVNQSLDGVWRFTTNVSNPPESWVDMTVPGNWDSTPEFSTYVGVGWYRRTFTPDPALQGKSVRLHFGAVYHEAEVFLNGASIGTHIGGYTPFEFDVTGLLNFGQPNEITVSADNTYKRGAWWPWGGISRSVQLTGNNPVRLVFQHIHGDPDLAAGTAAVFVKYRLQNTGATPADVIISSRLASWNQELVNATHTVNAGETKDVTEQFNLPAEQVRLWHFDHPEFYHLQTTLTVSGEVQHAVSDRFGIRKIEISATEFRLNGEPVRLVGFNRIADDAGRYGNTEPEVLVNGDVDLMKRAGANMQRIMCVPQATTLLNRMDEKGIMIVVGIPVWGDDPQTTVVDNPLTKQWLREMIERDYNHPCIIGWEVANESYQYLGYHENMMDYVRQQLDPHRIVTFTSWNSYRTDIAGTENQPVEQADLPMINMYRTFTEKLATQTARWPDKPFFLSECGIRQLVGGVNADFDPTFVPGWESFARGQFPNLMGASLWSFNDYRSNYPGTPPTGFRSWGVVDQHRNLKPAYHTIRKLHSPVEILKVNGVTATVKTRPPGHIPSYTLMGYKLVWEKGELTGEVPLPTLSPGDPAWTGDLPVSGAIVKLVTPLGYDIDDNIDRSSFSDGVGIVLDDPGAELVGTWNPSTTIPGFIGAGYRFSGTPTQPSNGTATATFRFTAPTAGPYRLDMAYSPGPTRAPNVPVTVTSGASTANFSVNQQTALDNGSYREIGTVTLVEDQETVITIGTAGTTGFVILDAIRFVPFSAPPPPPVEPVVIARYPFTSGSPASTDTESSSTAADFLKGPNDTPAFWGFSSSGNGNVYAQSRGTEGSEAAAVTANDYWSFTVTPDPGLGLNLSTLTFDTQHNATAGNGDQDTNATMGFFVRSSIDGYAGNIGSTFTQAWNTTSSRSIDLSAPAFQGLQTATTFRIYMFDSGINTASNGARLDNVVLNGNAVADATEAFLSGFTYDPATGACSVELKGAPGATFKFVEAANLDFGNPDQDPLPLTSVLQGTPVGLLPAAIGVVTDGNGNATVEFNLGTGKDRSFIRAEQTSP
jgi:hypothetical protein